MKDHDFEKTAVQYTPMIHHIIRSLSIYKNKDEYFQTGLIALWEAYQRYEPEKGRFLSLAYTIVKGRMQHQLRQEARHESRTTPADPLDELLLNAETEDRLFERELLLTYCEGLTLSQQIWLYASFYQQLSIKEIAERENTTSAAVKSWRKAALKKLRQRMVQEGSRSKKTDSSLF